MQRMDSNPRINRYSWKTPSPEQAQFDRDILPSLRKDWTLRATSHSPFNAPNFLLFKTMFSSKSLIALLCLPAFVLSASPVPKIGPRPLTTGSFAILSSIQNQRVDLSFSDGTNNNAVIGFFENVPATPNQQWTFVPTGAPNSFNIQNGVAGPVFLSYPSAPASGPVLFSQAVIHSTPQAFVLNSLGLGSPFFNILLPNGLALTNWPAPNIGQPSPLTFENRGGSLTAAQNWTLVAPGALPQDFRKMHRVLTIPELLEIIFSSTDELANARAVSVCKTWSGVARDTLWRDVRGLRRLFSPLAPVKRWSSYYEFQRPIEPSDWPRFHAVASRVKHLTIDKSDDRMFREAQLGWVSTTRPTFHILPSLTQLALSTKHTDEFMFSAIFLHSSLQRLVLRMPDTVLPRRFFPEVSLRCTKLSYLDLQMSGPGRTVEPELTDMLSTLTNLKTLVMPCYTISSSIMTSLSRLPNLGTVRTPCFTDREREDPADVQPFSPVLLEGAFPSLTELTCDTTLCDISSFLAAKFAPGNLTLFGVQTASIETPLSVFECLTTLVRTCERLRFLGLYLTIDGSGRNSDENSYSLSFKDLCPILDFPHLVSFELTHYRPLDITDDDIDHLAKNWPLLKFLNLNFEPVIFDRPKITFASLASFARHCPNLGHLRLYLDTSPDGFPKPAVPFRMLNSLAFGTSPIQSEDDCAFFLSEICPLSCKLEAKSRWHEVLRRDVMDDTDFAVEVQARQTKWQNVRDMLPRLTKLRREERERARELSHDLERKVQDLAGEAQDLKLRLKILEDFRVLHQSPGHFIE
ncbi:hypothetical protein BD410DRAFT_902402 [Rickenella mellea]|uniref:F-box domain-containing protein n=1 Tax=Rickenella mellea TaxID=50990 RepID=A0A4Y7PJW9_9AGAM|nr:hypothetical protein BD410DRAFT_902402 [Rickenella mellea]